MIGYFLIFSEWWANCDSFKFRDILHPGRANIAKDELREKLGSMYKASKDQINVFGLRTQFGGGKTTGFALVYDSPEAMKKYEPQYRLVRVGFATKAERASRQQRTLESLHPLIHEEVFGVKLDILYLLGWELTLYFEPNRETTQEPTKDSTGYCEGQGTKVQEGEINSHFSLLGVTRWLKAELWLWLCASCSSAWAFSTRRRIRRSEI
jgi:ribosomal protein S24E